MSTGNVFTEIKLDKVPSTLIIGKNGSGKSTLLDALTIGLFGKPFRKANKPTLCNAINEKDCLIEIEFSIGKKKFLVRRGIKPAIFEIYQNGQLKPQDARAKDYQDYLEKFILKMNYKSFTQIVVLGVSNFVPFMQLAALDRRTIIEDLLDIQIFSSMNLILKQRIIELKESFQRVKYQEDITKVKLESQKKLISEIENDNKDKIEANERDIKKNVDQIKVNREKIEELQVWMGKERDEIDDQIQISSKMKKLEDFSQKISGNISRIDSDICFYHENNNCPTCHQEINQEFKGEKIKGSENKRQEMKSALEEIEREFQVAKERSEHINSILKKIHHYSLEISKLNTSISGMNVYIERLRSQNQEFLTKRNDIPQKGSLVVLQKDLKKLEKQYKSLVEDRHYYEIATNLLKDTGIKTKIISKYLPIMNKLINKYLSDMEFYINFTLNDSFEESIKSRHRDEFSYENFSEGEKSRIDLALLFTWRSIAKMKNSAATNLMILDEVLDSSMDSMGIDLFLNILGDFAKDSNIFIISHKTDVMSDKFDDTIKFTKQNNFSVIEEEK